MGESTVGGFKQLKNDFYAPEETRISKDTRQNVRDANAVHREGLG